MAGIDQRTFWDFAKVVLKGKDGQPAAKAQATFLRTDPDGTQWVQLAGSSEETPVNGNTIASAQAGDVVELTVNDGLLSISGNATEPSVGMRSVAKATNEAVGKVVGMVKEAGDMAQLSKRVADAAQAVASAVNQHFFSDDNGIHVTEATQDDWDENHSGANVLINALGQLFRDGLNNLLTLTTENGARALTVWDGLGNTADHIRAIIGEIIQLGSVASGNYMTLDDTGVEIYNENKTDGYSAKIGATFAEFLGGLLKLRYHLEGTSDDPIYISDIRHTVPNEIGSLGFLEFKTLNAGKSNEKTVASIVADEVNVYGQLTGSISTAFDVTTVQLMEGTTSIAAGGSTSTATVISDHGADWYPLGIVGWACNYGEITMARCRITNAGEGVATIEYVVHNTGTTARKPNLNVHVLWVRMGDY